MPTTEACPPLCLKVFRRPRSHHDVKPYTAPKVLYPRYVGKQRQKIPPPLFFSFNPVEKTYFELLRCGIQYIKSLFYRWLLIPTLFRNFEKMIIKSVSKRFFFKGQSISGYFVCFSSFSSLQLKEGIGLKPRARYLPLLWAVRQSGAAI